MPRPWTGSRSLLSSVPLMVAVAGVVMAGGCKLEEASLALPEDVLVVEAYLMVGDETDEANAFLHWTLGTRPDADLLDASVTVMTEDSLEVRLFHVPPSDCVFLRGNEEVDGVCYSVGSDAEDVFVAGSHAEITVRLKDGREVRGGTDIPVDIQFIQPSMTDICGLPPGQQVEFTWNRSPGVWAYSAETEITGLTDALAAQGIEAEADSVALLGLAVSESDTTIVFPGEFGVFDRFSLDPDIALALQEGLPQGANAEVVVAALDQNYVNWVRGGNFNPSGTVRVSSLRGDGVGVFASAVRRVVRVVGTTPTSFIPSCFAGS